MSLAQQHGSARFTPNIPRYFVYTALKGFSFGLFAAIWVIYLQQQRGLSLSQAALTDVTFFVAAALAEVPTGMVADRFGRKTSLLIGSALMGTSTLAWVFAPTLPLILLAYICLGIGFTFLSGAEDALFYESVQLAGRGADYTRLVGRGAATMTGALALGSVASGLLASVALPLPFLVAVLSDVILVAIVLTFKEPDADRQAKDQARRSCLEVLRQSLALMRARPILRSSMIYLALVPVIALMLETLFVQPQAMKWGTPIAGIGLVIMGLQMTSIAGASWSDWLGKHVGRKHILYAAPILIVISLILLAALQVFPALFFMGVISFMTAAQHPIVFSSIQAGASDDMRATLLSMLSFMGTGVAAIAQPTLSLIADHAGLPTMYVVLAASLGLLMVIFFWTSRHHFP
ncbi:MAG TPA: MFS transporter [Ktedonosporobacter sp.]|nr:MFS transporter [Ktedonosporobacter sp.]